MAEAADGPPALAPGSLGPAGRGRSLAPPPRARAPPQRAPARVAGPPALPPPGGDDDGEVVTRADLSAEVARLLAAHQAAPRGAFLPAPAELAPEREPAARAAAPQLFEEEASRIGADRSPQYMELLASLGRDAPAPSASLRPPHGRGGGPAPSAMVATWGKSHGLGASHKARASMPPLPPGLAVPPAAAPEEGGVPAAARPPPPQGSSLDLALHCLAMSLERSSGRS